MIPWTDSVIHRMMARVLEILVESGLVEQDQDAEAMADQVMGVLESQGMIANGMVILGQCVLLPPLPGIPAVRLLFATPCPADEYDTDLRPKPSPVRFEQTERGEIIIPGRWLSTKLEELAANPSTLASLRTLALGLSRQAHVPDMVLPLEAETVALRMADADGSERIIEALPGGIIISLAISLARAE